MDREGGTGAAPLTFADYVSLSYKIGSGKLVFPDRVIVAFCLGAGLVNIAREAMLSISCIQARSATPASARLGKSRLAIATQRDSPNGQ